MSNLLHDVEHQRAIKRRYNAKLKKLGIEFNRTRDEDMDIYNEFTDLREKLRMTNKETLRYLLSLDNPGG